MSTIVGLGTATASNVLANQTFTSGSGANQAGSMPNNGAVTITPSNLDEAIPLGYHDGTGKVPAVTFDASKLLLGTTIAGTPGAMPNEGAVTLTPSGTGAVVIPAGYHNGSGTVAKVNVPAANVLTGTTIASVAGTMPNQGSPTLQPGASITPRYYPGGSVAAPTAGSQTFTSAGSFTWTVPSGVTRVIAELLGGGGGGGCNGGGTTEGAGSGAAYAAALLDVTPGQVISGIVGAGGAGSSTANTGGLNGQSTTFGSLVANHGLGGGGYVNGGAASSNPVSGGMYLVSFGGGQGENVGGYGGGGSGGSGGAGQGALNSNGGAGGSASVSNGLLNGSSGGGGNGSGTAYSAGQGGGGGSGSVAGSQGGTGVVKLTW